MSASDENTVLIVVPPPGARRFVLDDRSASRMIDTLAQEVAALSEEEEKHERSLVKRLQDWRYVAAMIGLNAVLAHFGVLPLLRDGLTLAVLTSAAIQIYCLVVSMRFHRRNEVLYARLRVFHALVSVEKVEPTS